MEIDRKICVLLNLKLDSRVKLNRFLHLLRVLSTSDSFCFLIRVRGDLSEEAGEHARILLSVTKSQFRIVIGNSVQNWKLNTYTQVLSSDSEYFLLLNEDHLPVQPIENILRYLNHCKENLVDVGILAFPQTFYSLFTFLQDDKLKRFIFLNMTHSFWKKIPCEIRNYPVSLVGFYRRDFLLKILLSRRPIYRRYAFNSPFEFEQSGDASWIFPMKIGLAKEEFFGCIDDDGGIENSSLIARGIWLDDSNFREPSHHKKFFLEQYIETSFESRKFKKKNPIRYGLILQRKMFNLLRKLIYTLHGLLSWDIQKIIIRLRMTETNDRQR